MASLDELREETRSQAEEEAFDDDDDGAEQLMEQDVRDCLALLDKCKVMFDYLSDPDLCKSVTKREREAMGRISSLIWTHVDDLDERYRSGEE